MFPDGEVNGEEGAAHNSHKCNFVIIVAENNDSPLQQFML